MHGPTLELLWNSAGREMIGVVGGSGPLLAVPGLVIIESQTRAFVSNRVWTSHEPPCSISKL
jgi:hypothetical protein